ncbi:MAG: hypothetical protein B7Z75_08455 [Acidocella sp. 20-57-95]|nr:MAG: hypothetical protein B7Z75_08455 [Acidocella sp. 20-57-95]OYV59492.1 MAG: hypothetical protein B7Z71_08010 [Acidocella sp. 21-58-7]
MLAAHADWSVDPRKRWVTYGVKTPQGWRLDAPTLVGEVSTLLERLTAAASGGAVALGIDCPVGLPPAYAAQLQGFEDFPSFLRQLTPDMAFFSVAKTIDEVGLARPFFPAGSVKGPGHKLALARALNLPDTASLSRLVDLRTAHRPAGGQLFWTLGANQCGKAGLAAWRDLIVPGLAQGRVRLWPFEGALRDLARPGQVAIAETYPAEALRQLGLKLQGSKQRQASRAAMADDIFGVMQKLQAAPSAALTAQIVTGFGPPKSSEDPFDSLIGVLGVMNVLAGHQPDISPLPNDKWQGWVLGQTDMPLDTSRS